MTKNLKNVWQKPWLIFLSLFSIALFFYLDAFSHFFYQDDLFHFHISNAKSLADFASFFNPINEFAYQIYRPLGTQVVFFFMQNLFGINHSAFTLFIILLLSTNAWLIYKLLIHKTTPIVAWLLSVFYIVHHQNIGIVYFLSTVQLSLALLLTLLALHTIRIKPKFWQAKTLLFYFLAIFCQEISLLNSLIFTLLLWLEEPKKIKEHAKLIIALGLVTLSYLAFRFYFLNAQIFDNTHYQISLNPKSIFNNIAWFTLWMLSVPEYVVNFIGSSFKPLAPLFGQYILETFISFAILVINGSVLITFIKKFLSKPRTFVYLICFLLSLAPVLVFPWHKYVYHLPIASVFILLFIASLIGKVKNKVTLVLLFLLIANATMSNLIDRSTSYNYKRGEISNHFRQIVNFDKLKEGNLTVLVANDPDFEVFSKDWGNTSTQAKIILKEDLFFKLLSGNQNLKVVYEDDLKDRESISPDYVVVAKQN